MRIFAACLVLTACSTSPAQTDQAAVTSLPSQSPAPSCAAPASSPAPRTADALAQACPDSTDGLWPIPNPCKLYDADVGDSGTCCGGDLRTQRCGDGLTCLKSPGQPIGWCASAQYAAPGPVCVWFDDPYPEPLGYCGLLVAGGFDSQNCTLVSSCANHEQVLGCENGQCSCTNYGVFTDPFPVGDICSSTWEHALAFAQEKCGFPSCYQDLEQGVEDHTWK